MSDSYFLSAENPLANIDQRDLDAMAVELFARPDVRMARDMAAGALARVTSNTASAEMWSMHQAYADSFAFRSIQIAVNSDANYPRIYRVYTPPATFLGNTTPASRWGSENPDNIYRIIPVAPDGQYVIRGQRQPNPPSNVSFVVVADTNTSVTVSMLEDHQLAIAPDGSFEITLDNTPANGRSNHLQLAPDALYVFIRDSLGDWNQTVNALRVKRLNAPTRGPKTMDELAARCARVMQLGTAPAYYWSRLVLNNHVNTVHAPHGTGPSGGLLTQMSSAGWFQLEDDEAAVVTFDPLDCAYHSLVLSDLWGRSLEYRDHTSCLNNGQMIADADGRYTCVISIRDPGVHNWIDTVGLHEVIAGIRWQGIAAHEQPVPQVSAQVVKLAELDSHLPDGVQRASAEDRAQQLAQRRAAHDRRYIET